MNNNFRHTVPAHAHILNLMSAKQEDTMLKEMLANDPQVNLFNAQIREGLVDEEETLEYTGPEHTMNLLDSMSGTDFSAQEALTDRLATPDEEDGNPIDPENDEFNFIKPGEITAFHNRVPHDLSAYEGNPLKGDGKFTALHFQSARDFRKWKNDSKRGGLRGVGLHFTSEEEVATLAALAEHELERERAILALQTNLPRVPNLNRAPARASAAPKTPKNTPPAEKKEFPFLRAQDRDSRNTNH